MARKYYKKRSFKRKTFKRKTFKRKSYKRSFKKLPLTGMPRKKVIRLKYCQEIILNSGAVGQATTTFRANGMYDPFVALGGHQPSGFDQIMPFYDHYIVLSSKMTARYVPSVTSNVVPCYLTAEVSDAVGPSSYSNAEEFLESRNVGNQYISTGCISGYRNQKDGQLTRYWSGKKMFGNTYMNSDHKGTETSDPAEGAYFHIIQMPVQGTDPGETQLLVTIEYIALVFEAKAIPSS